MKLQTHQRNDRTYLLFAPQNRTDYDAELTGDIETNSDLFLKINVRNDGFGFADITDLKAAAALESWNDEVFNDAVTRCAQFGAKGGCVIYQPEYVYLDEAGQLKMLALPYRGQESAGSEDELRKILKPINTSNSLFDDFDWSVMDNKTGGNVTKQEEPALQNGVISIGDDNEALQEEPVGNMFENPNVSFGRESEQQDPNKDRDAINGYNSERQNSFFTLMGSSQDTEDADAEEEKNTETKPGLFFESIGFDFAQKDNKDDSDKKSGGIGLFKKLLKFADKSDSDVLPGEEGHLAFDDTGEKTLYLSHRKWHLNKSRAKRIPHSTSVRIGRTGNESQGDIIIKNKTVSETQACIKCEHGQYYLYDGGNGLPSTNGTYLNGTKVNFGDINGVLIQEGSEIRFADCVFYALFEREDKE